MDNEQMRSELRAHIAKKYKTQAAAADKWNLSPAFISLVLSGDKLPNTKMLTDAGIERVDPPAYYRKLKGKNT